MNDHVRPSSELVRQQLESDFARLNDRTFVGYIVDKGDLFRRFVVEILVDGYPTKLTRADGYHNELALEGVGDGCYAFACDIPERVIDQASVIEARIANTTVRVGEPIVLAASADRPAAAPLRSDVDWLGGLHFEGWYISDDQNPPEVRAIIDGEEIAAVQATRWANVGTSNVFRLARRFNLHLPDQFADGRVRRVQFLLGNGEELRGSPITFVAFYDGLIRSIDELNAAEGEQLRALQFDRIFPMSIPFSEYEHWGKRFPIGSDGGAANASIAVALIGAGDAEASASSLQDNDFKDWVVGALDETAGRSGFDREQMLRFLTEDAADSAYIVFTHAGSVFAVNALQRVAAAFEDFPDATCIYGDFDLLASDGGKWPVALPSFDYERLLEQGYCTHLFALRRQKALEAVQSGAADLYSLFLAALDTDTFRVVHVPGALATIPLKSTTADRALLDAAGKGHLADRGITAKTVEVASTLFPTIHIAREIPSATTTIIIPVRNRLELLQTCLRSIAPVVGGRADLMIVDNGSDDPKMLSYLRQLNDENIRVISAPGPFNFAHLNNLAAEQSRGDFLCLLNNDVVAIDDKWLGEMLSRISGNDVGAVGALLLWPSGVVQHGGTVLGPSFAATHAFSDRLHDDPGYTEILLAAHECSAVTAACMLTRRSDYLDVGGMDAVHFPVNFNDVDYCLRLREKGKRIILTPHARLYHHESASRGRDETADKAKRFSRELTCLRARWGNSLLEDAYYSPVLSLDPTPFSALAWPPRNRRARMNRPPQASDLPRGF
jgi:GT2 family glycosyltransferase